MSDTDLDLLARYIQHRAEDAFAEVVRRHIDLVHSAALRQVRSPQLAEEIAQSTFLKLAHHAGQLAPDTILAAWLYQVARRESIDVVRREVRRQLREQVAAEMNAMNATAADWTHIEPLLDEAMHALDETDRTAVLLRYFQNRSLREVGESLGASEEAARKRIGRALERLREFFAQRGVTVGASGLAVSISANAVQAAPVGLAVTISTAVTLAGTTLVTTSTATTTKVIAMTATKNALIAITLVATVATGVYEARKVSIAHAQIQTLQRQQSSLTEQIEGLQRERQAATNELAFLMGRLARDSNVNSELLRLRGEVARMRTEAQRLANTKPGTAENSAALEDQTWLERVRRLKQRLAETPEAQIPEHHYLTDEDWLMAAKLKLDSDEDYRAAFVRLSGAGEGAFLRITEAALRKYLEASKGEFPEDISHLKPFFELPPVDGVLERYHIVAASSIPRANLSGNAGDWLITPKSPRDDQWLLGRNGLSGVSHQQEMDVLAPAISALNEATPMINGKRSIELRQLLPYLTTPEQKAAYEKLMQGKRPTENR